MPAYGITAAGFVVKPLQQIMLDMQTSIWSSVNPQLDLSAQTPDGQILGIYSADIASVWELLQIDYNEFNRSDAEGQALDNIGDMVGNPREGEDYTQVFCNCTLTNNGGPLSNGVYPAGSLVCNVAGQSAFTFANLNQVTVTVSGVQVGILFQSTTIGPTSAVNPGTLTAITTPVAGWTAVTNPLGQSQLGDNAELDAAYALRQAQEVAAPGSCNPAATADAIVSLGAAQDPPQTLTVSVQENPGTTPITVGSLTLPRNTYAVIIYDGGTGWAAGAGSTLIAQTIYANKPQGIMPVGAISVTITDPTLGPQTVSYSVPTAAPLFISATVVPRTAAAGSQAFTNLVTAIQNALVAAAVAPNLPGGIPPAGQLAPGSPVIGSQLEAVIMSVAGTLDVQALTFGFAASPTNTAPLIVPATQVATISAATASINVVISFGVYP